MLAPFGQSATSIFWSLGGLHARALAKPLWPQMRQVTMIGTPCNANNNPTNAGWMRRLFSGESPAFDAALSAADGGVSGGGRSKTLATLAGPLGREASGEIKSGSMRKTFSQQSHGVAFAVVVDMLHTRPTTLAGFGCGAFR